MPTPLTLTWPPALIAGLPKAVPSASKNASAIRCSVALASSLASPLLAATRSAIAVVPPPRSLATLERCTPACDEVCALLAVPVTACLFLGSHARMLTVCGCCTPLMRGRNEIMLSCHVSSVGAPSVLFALRKLSLLSVTTTS